MKKKSLKFTGTVPHVPTDAPDPWGLTIGTVQGEITLSSSLSRPADRLVLHITDVTLLSALHWVYKKRWNHSHRIPSGAKTFEPWGDYFHAILSLCIELHAMNPLGKRYINAGEWFLCICREFRRSGFEAGQDKHSKVSDLASLRTHTQMLRDYNNPIDQTKEPHTWALYQSAVEMADSGRFPALVRELWSGSAKRGRFERKGLIPASVALYAHLESSKNLAAVWTSEDGLIVQGGRGNNNLLAIGNPLIEAVLSDAKSFNSYS
jgi:hypothetical protein